MTSSVSNTPGRPRQEPRPAPVTFDALASYSTPNDARLAPDGSCVAFVLRPAGKEDEHPQHAIWVVPFGDGEPAQFTGGLWADQAPRWSPDGAQLAFISDRAERGKSSLYVMPAHGGEARRVFDQQGEISSPDWSPDGRFLAVLFVDPETDDEKKRKEARDDAKVWDANPKYRRLWVVDLATGETRAVTPAQRQVHVYAWSPDSSRLAYCSTPTPRVDDIFLETELAVIPRAGGEPRIIGRQTGVTENLTWSADGANLAYRGPGGRVVHAEYVYRVAAADGTRTCLTPGYTGTAEHLTTLDDELLMLSSEGVNSIFYRLSWEGAMAPLLRGEPWGAVDGGASVSDNATRMAFAHEGPTSASDIWVVDLATSDRTPQRRTHFNPALEGAALGETEVVRWSSDPGVDVEGILVKPHGYEEGVRYPLVVQVHGGPSWHWSNRFYAGWHDWAQMLAGRGYAVLLPNPRGSTGRGAAFTNAIVNDVGGGEYRDMLAGIDALITRGLADPDALGIGGWSWGGYMTAWAISQTTRFKAAVMGAGLPNMISDNGIGDIPSANLSYFDQSPYHDPEPFFERSAIRHIRNTSTPTLILHGEADERVNMWQGVEMYVALRTLGVTTTLVTYPREPHGIAERKHQVDLMRRVVDWYDIYLRPELRDDSASASKGDTDGGC